MMLVLSAQKYSTIKSIFNDSYIPNLWMSDNMFLSPKYTQGYSQHIKMLEKKCGVQRTVANGMYWCWVDNPYFSFYEKNWSKSLNDRLFACFIEIDEKDLVISDYDEYCDFINGEFSGNFFKSVDNIGMGECLQGVFCNLDKHAIKSIVDMDYLYALEGFSIKTIFELYLSKNQLYDFSKGIDNFYIEGLLST